MLGSILRTRDKAPGAPCFASRHPGNAVTGLAVLAACCCLLLADHASAQSREPAASAPAGSDAGADEGVFVELGGGFATGQRGDAYDHRLRVFDFKSTSTSVGRLDVAIGLRVQQHLALGIEYFGLDGADYKRDVDNITQKFVWDSRAIGAFVQGDLGLGPQRIVNIFVRGGAGIAFGSTGFDAVNIEAPNADASPDFQTRPATLHHSTEAIAAPCVSLAAGISVNPFKNWGVQVMVRQSYAPGLKNELGDTHDLGDVAVIASMRLRSWQ